MPLKHKAPSGENDFQPTQRPHRLKEHGSGVGCPNSPCHYITCFSSVSLREAASLGCPSARRVVQQALLHREEYGLCVSAFGVLGLIRGLRRVRYKLNYSLAQLQFPCLLSLLFFPPHHLLPAYCRATWDMCKVG